MYRGGIIIPDLCYTCFGFICVLGYSFNSTQSLESYPHLAKFFSFIAPLCLPFKSWLYIALVLNCKIFAGTF